MDKVLSIIELPPFKKEAPKIFKPEELLELKAYIKANPTKGDIIQGTGGIRKLRWSAGGKGKSGGARVIYFYYILGKRIHLMTCYTKNVQSDISPKVKKQLKAIVDLITKGGS